MSGLTRKYAMMAVTIGVMAACSPQERFHGFVPTQLDQAEIQVGQSDRAAVLTAFGPPLTEGVLEQQSFYYVSSKFRRVGLFAPQEVDRQVLAVRFDQAGLVRNIERFGLADGRVVALDRRVTEDGINDVGFLAQLLGSLGRVDAGALLGDDQ